MSQTIQLRTITPHERDAVLDLLSEWISRDFFRRYFEHDPTFREDLCLVAVASGRIVSTLQVFEKNIRWDGATVRVGGVGNVFTIPAFRGQGIASELLHRAVAAMEEDGFDLSLLFAERLGFYTRLGWRSHTRQLVFMDAAQSSLSDQYVIRPFAGDSDLGAVMAIYEVYSGRLPGTTVRDRRYWRGQLRYAGNLHEDFLVAQAERPGGLPVAYARGAPLYDFYVIMEHGYLPGHEAALTDLVCRLHSVEGANFPGTLAQIGAEPNTRQALAARGLELRMIEDVFWMWRVISAPRLARKLAITSADVERDDFWSRFLPADTSVFWISDRF